MREPAFATAAIHGHSDTHAMCVEAIRAVVTAGTITIVFGFHGRFVHAPIMHQGGPNGKVGKLFWKAGGEDIIDAFDEIAMMMARQCGDYF